MALLELVSPTPDWKGALGKALQRPTGIPERRSDPTRGEEDGEHHRASDDLTWLRGAVEHPDDHGLEELPDTSAVAIWKADLDRDSTGRLCRLRDRGVLDAAGFLLHESSAN